MVHSTFESTREMEVGFRENHTNTLSRQVHSLDRATTGAAAPKSHHQLAKMASPNRMNTQRGFQDDMDVHHHHGSTSFLVDSSILSMESKDTAFSSLTADAHDADATSTIASSDCATEVSSVAHLRGWLDDFGKQQKKHYEKNMDVEKKKQQQQQQTGAQASSLVKRLVISESSSSSTKSSKDSTSRRKNYATPVRIMPKFEEQEVQATNDGYASVAKLSAWLADDPTSTKKVKQIRRGANVIAKSRKFDKGLANVIVEQTKIRSGSVLTQKNILERMKSQDEDEPVEEWPKARSTVGVMDFKDAATTISVSNKKEWLQNAFKRNENAPVPRAKTDFVTSSDKQDDVTAKAKQLWRIKRTPPRNKLPTQTLRSIDSTALVTGGSKQVLNEEKSQEALSSVARPGRATSVVGGGVQFEPEEQKNTVPLPFSANEILENQETGEEKKQEETDVTSRTVSTPQTTKSRPTWKTRAASLSMVASSSVPGIKASPLRSAKPTSTTSIMQADAPFDEQSEPKQETESYGESDMQVGDLVSLAADEPQPSGDSVPDQETPEQQKNRSCTQFEMALSKLNLKRQIMKGQSTEGKKGAHGNDEPTLKAADPETDTNHRPEDEEGTLQTKLPKAATKARSSSFQTTFTKSAGADSANQKSSFSSSPAAESTSPITASETSKTTVSMNGPANIEFCNGFKPPSSTSGKSQPTEDSFGLTQVESAEASVDPATIVACTTETSAGELETTYEHSDSENNAASSENVGNRHGSFNLDMIVSPSLRRQQPKKPPVPYLLPKSKYKQEKSNTTENDDDMGPVGFHAARESFLRRLRPPSPEPEPESESDDDKPVDFRKAREILVKRSKKNGNAVEVLTKVNRRRAKFERIGQETRRRSSVSSTSSGGSSKGGRLRRASWQPLSTGCFEKTLVEVPIAPKKSFEDLP
jgi:hypothetical protein